MESRQSLQALHAELAELERTAHLRNLLLTARRELLNGNVANADKKVAEALALIPRTRP